VKNLFEQELKVINIGLQSFTQALDDCGAKSVQVDWKPPLGASPQAASVIAAKHDVIEQANQQALEKIIGGKPFLTGLGKAIDLVPSMKKNLLLHAGPPIAWDRMCGPMRGAIMGALIYEGLAKNPEEAEALASSGKIEYAPCHEHGAVGPMAGSSRPRCRCSSSPTSNTATAHTPR